MARKIAKPKAAPAAAATSELEVLHPERSLVLAGQAVTVREYGNIEWLRLLPSAEPLVNAVAQMLDSAELPSYETALDCITRHVDGLLPLIVQAVDKDMAWVETLDPGELELLLMTWWGVNGHFFVKRATNRVGVAREEQRLAARLLASGGARSTPP
ncbi:Phage protein [plant metagenome]|uniref:Phage protein n=1 Tax=plant metagenome TaxID=1297885 RepID=A0A484XKM6_9ZZZZ